jgi:hypothetical protein
MTVLYKRAPPWLRPFVDIKHTQNNLINNSQLLEPRSLERTHVVPAVRPPGHTCDAIYALLPFSLRPASCVLQCDARAYTTIARGELK